jgi:voltage-gated potassium channel
MSPLVVFLLIILILLGWRVARIEGWGFGLGVYCAFITATTVGYGDIRPTKPKSRFNCIIIALAGLVLTGILVALAIESVRLALPNSQIATRLSGRFNLPGL